MVNTILTKRQWDFIKWAADNDHNQFYSGDFRVELKNTPIFLPTEVIEIRLISGSGEKERSYTFYARDTEYIDSLIRSDMIFALKRMWNYHRRNGNI